MNALYKYIRFWAYTIEILVFFVIERIPNLVPSVNHVKPMIRAPVAVMIVFCSKAENVGDSVWIYHRFVFGYQCDGQDRFLFGGFGLVAGFLVGTAAQKIIKFNLITSVAFCKLRFSNGISLCALYF